MAIFKVGQRVRIVNYDSFLCGREATIIGEFADNRIARRDLGGGTFSGYPLDIDGHGRFNSSGLQIYARPENLAPLTDPGADRFIESIKRMEREPVNVAPKLPVHEPNG